MNASFVLLGAGLDSHRVNVGRNILLARMYTYTAEGLIYDQGDKYELDLIGGRCNISFTEIFARKTVDGAKLSDILTRLTGRSGNATLKIVQLHLASRSPGAAL